MDLSSACKYGEVIRGFLNNPLDRRRFNEFYSFAFRVSVGYLHYLKSQGFVLPEETGSREEQIHDLAIDTLGILLRCDGDRPFYTVFDYVKQRGIDNYESAEPESLYDVIVALLKGNIRQELARIRKQTDPQVENLKRRFKDILRTGPFGLADASGPGQTGFAYSMKYRAHLRAGKKRISRDELAQVVREALKFSSSRQSWCETIFDLLNEMPQYQNLISKSDLLAVVVSVNREWMESDLEVSVFTGETPVGASVKASMSELIPVTLDWAESSLIARFVDSRKITKRESISLMAALEAYLTDLCEQGETDPLPVYFRENMPTDTHAKYLEEYKYVFETLVDKAVRELRNSASDEATKLGLGDYL
jgi:hypothetical protein